MDFPMVDYWGFEIMMGCRSVACWETEKMTGSPMAVCSGFEKVRDYPTVDYWGFEIMMGCRLVACWGSETTMGCLTVVCSDVETMMDYLTALGSDGTSGSEIMMDSPMAVC
jgi:hypothetical protein